MTQHPYDINLAEANHLNKKKWWRISNAVSGMFLGLIGLMWFYTTKRYEPNTQQLTNKAEVDKFLSENFSDLPNRRIPTGVFIQSLKFNSSSEVNFSGYIWQTYDRSEFEGTPTQNIRVGFVLPETVESGNNIEPKLSYIRDKGSQVVLGWYFEATLKQKFKYTKYPFDHKTVWIRIWSNDFEQETVLIPDLSSYAATGIDDDFGYDEDIVLGQWKLLETFFDYQTKSYNSNFGLSDSIITGSHPELYFNIVIKRRFLNSFVIYILPLSLIACLTFSMLLMVSKNPERSSLFGVNPSGVIGVCSSLFFVVLLSQVQIREQFSGANIVYIEYFYPLMYGALLAVSANAYLISLPNTEKNPILSWIESGDNIHPKLMYWPLLLGSATLITALILLPSEPDSSVDDQLVVYDTVLSNDQRLQATQRQDS
ncbi:hypothetical protein [Adonisia turfae]|uniref:hypothetical protein n=1 Tax=Adonisia turfae TaxID=2950184 RepID=UPI0020299D5E|nr:hypothetical protein [Adonisia turfae]